jgi:probable F420-dependent oxidoreductase
MRPSVTDRRPTVTDMIPPPFRFGVNVRGCYDGPRWLSTCARAEELGFDVVLCPDQIEMSSPFPALVAAASVTSRVRLGTYVVNTAFHAPPLLARDVAMTDQLTGGRLELGLGAGYIRDDFTAAGLRYPTGPERLQHLVTTVEELRGLLADPEFLPAPVQRPVPLLLGGYGDRTLRLAARYADIVGLTGLGTDPDGGIWLEPAGTLAERVAFTRDAAGDRADGLVFNLLVHKVAVTADEAETDAVHAGFAPQMSRAEFGALATVLCCPVEEMLGKLRDLRERVGIGYVTVPADDMEQFAPVMARLRGE